MCSTEFVVIFKSHCLRVLLSVTFFHSLVYFRNSNSFPLFCAPLMNENSIVFVAAVSIIGFHSKMIGIIFAMM